MSCKVNKVKFIKLKRSGSHGFGFSILGGLGSELPPLIYDVIEGSPAYNSKQLSPGDVILEINGQDVLNFTTKEVLNCLRLSAQEVILKLKTDRELKDKVNHLRQTPNNSDILRTAITRDDLQGVKRIVAKKTELKSSENIKTELKSSENISSKKSSENCSQESSENNRSKNTSERQTFEVRTDVEKNIQEDDVRSPPHENDTKSHVTHVTEKSDDSGGVAPLQSQPPRPSCAATSPPLSEDESDIESLHSFHYSPKAVDIPSAVRLAKRLFALDGFKKSDVSRHLSKNNEFSKAVAEEYLGFFEFRNNSLDVALRKFLDKFCLSGETQERERVLVHFSKRFLECNQHSFNSQDAVHTLTCALMLLNTDLHSQNVGRRMTSSEFIDNLAELNDGENFDPEILKALYKSIRAEPLKWATDEDDEGKTPAVEEEFHVVGANPFLSPPMGSGVVYKKGYIMRKCCIEPSGKRTAFGKRSWKMWFCVIQDLVLYLHKDEQGARRGPLPQMGHNAVRLHHALAQKAHDYAKKEHVFRLHTADQAEYLLQTSDNKELQAWIDAINFVAASLSAQPMPGAVGSQRKFQRPLLPCSITKLNVIEQLEDHTTRVTHLETDLNHLKTHPPDKAAKSATVSNHREKEAYLTSELKRYQTYVYLLRSRLESSGEIVQTGGAVCGLELNELPVFEVNTDPVEMKERVTVGCSSGDSGGIVPPPIPDRPKPSTDSEENDEKDTSEEKKMAVEENCKKIKKERRSSKNEDEFKKELDKIIKEKEKKDKKIRKQEEKEQNLTLKRKKKQEKRDKERGKNKNEKMKGDEGNEKSENEKVENVKDKVKNGGEKVENEKDKVKNGGEKEKEKILKEKEKIEKATADSKNKVKHNNNVQEPETVKNEENGADTEDHRIGTFNRLAAIFKFSKLNRGKNSRRNSTCDEQDRVHSLQKCETFKLKIGEAAPPVSDIGSFPLTPDTELVDEPIGLCPKPPPLPPKPGVDSPVRKNLGTRVMNA